MICEVETTPIDAGRYEHRCIRCCAVYQSRASRIVAECPIGDPEACQHRGKVLRLVKNELCGCADRNEQVLQCSIHGECTVRKYKSNQPEASCLSCWDFVPIVTEA